MPYVPYILNIIMSYIHLLKKILLCIAYYYILYISLHRNHACYE